MMRLLGIYIVGLTTLLLASSCEHYELRYKIPKGDNCRILSKTIFCIDQNTGEEFEIPLSEGIGFVAYPPDYEQELREFGQMILLENLEFSKCRSRKCIYNLLKQHAKE